MSTRRPDPNETARALLQAVMLVMRSVAAEMRRSHEPLEPGQLAALMHVAGTPCTMTELARHLNVKLPTVSRSVGMLVRRGWIERLTSEGDRRRTIVTLTPKGRKVLGDMKSQTERHVADALTTLTGADRAALVAALETVTDALSV